MHQRKHGKQIAIPDQSCFCKHSITTAYSNVSVIWKYSQGRALVLSYLHFRLIRLKGMKDGDRKSVKISERFATSGS